MMGNKNFLTQIGFDTAENGPSKSWVYVLALPVRVHPKLSVAPAVCLVSPYLAAGADAREALMRVNFSMVRSRPTARVDRNAAVP